MEMIPTGHPLCCFLTDHHVDALGQTVADEVPFSHPDFPAPFPFLLFFAWVEIEPVM